MTINRQKTDVEYYSDHSRLNKSMLSIFAKSPAEYRRQIDNPVVLEGPQFRAGTMIHKYILEHGDFWNEYYRQYTESPNKSKNQKAFADRLVEENFSGEVDLASTIYKECYSAKSIKATDYDAILSAAIEEVFEWVKESLDNKGKIPVTSNEMNKLKEYVEKINAHKGARMLLQENSSDYMINSDGDIAHGDIIAFSEFHINWEHKLAIPCKSLIDRVVFNMATKKIWLIDLKTTSDLSSFKDSFEKYTYGMQLSFYRMALRWFIENEIGDNPENWSIEAFIIAIEKSTADISAIRINDSILDNEEKYIDSIIDNFVWHKENDVWNMSRSAYENDGIELTV